jgi:hypothetical protein
MSLSKKAPGIKYGNKVPAVEHTYEHIIPPESSGQRDKKRSSPVPPCRDHFSAAHKPGRAAIRKIRK